MSDKELKEIEKECRKLNKEEQTQQKAAKKETEDKRDADLRSTSKTFKFNQNDFYLQGGRYLRVWRDAKVNRMEEELTNFHIVLQEETVLMRVGGIESRQRQLPKTGLTQAPLLSAKKNTASPTSISESGWQVRTRSLERCLNWRDRNFGTTGRLTTI